MSMKLLQGGGIEINEVLTNLKNFFEEKSLMNWDRIEEMK